MTAILAFLILTASPATPTVVTVTDQNTLVAPPDPTRRYLRLRVGASEIAMPLLELRVICNLSGAETLGDTGIILDWGAIWEIWEYRGPVACRALQRWTIPIETQKNDV